MKARTNMIGMRRAFAWIAVWMAMAGALAAQSSKKYIEVEVKDGGAIRGKVEFKGDVPRLMLVVNNDLKVCDHDGGEKQSPRLTVGPDGGMANAVVYLKDVKQGKPVSTLETANVLNQQGCTYEPFVQLVAFKDTLVIRNSDPLNHNVHAKLGNRSIFNNAMPNETSTLEKRQIRVGVVRVNCDVHMWMSAYIHVVRHPYYAVTGSDGSFALTDIPPGNYELTVWIPQWQAKAKKDKNGKVVGYDFGEPIELRRKVKVGPGTEAVENFIANE